MSQIVSESNFLSKTLSDTHVHYHSHHTDKRSTPADRQRGRHTDTPQKRESSTDTNSIYSHKSTTLSYRY